MFRLNYVAAPNNREAVRCVRRHQVWAVASILALTAVLCQSALCLFTSILTLSDVLRDALLYGLITFLVIAVVSLVVTMTAWRTLQVHVRHCDVLEVENQVRKELREEVKATTGRYPRHDDNAELLRRQRVKNTQ